MSAVLMRAKFAGVCACGRQVAKGAAMGYDRGLRRIVTCTGCGVTDSDVAAITEATTTARRGRYQSNYTRFSSGAEVFSNKRGRCEDAPCCGCCS